MNVRALSNHQPSEGPFLLEVVVVYLELLVTDLNETVNIFTKLVRVDVERMDRWVIDFFGIKLDLSHIALVLEDLDFSEVFTFGIFDVFDGIDHALTVTVTCKDNDIEVFLCRVSLL